jgi:hypothetical protein
MKKHWDRPRNFRFEFGGVAVAKMENYERISYG